MFEKLEKLLKNSYSPYSHFQVACIVVMKDGREFCGVNVENASYGATICAERSAILSAISNGYKKHEFQEMHILTSGNRISTSCFLCRQVMNELFEKDVPVYFYDEKKNQKKFTIEELCPHPFDSEDLK